MEAAALAIPQMVELVAHGVSMQMEVVVPLELTVVIILLVAAMVAEARHILPMLVQEGCREEAAVVRVLLLGRIQLLPQAQEAKSVCGHIR